MGKDIEKLNNDVTYNEIETFDNLDDLEKNVDIESKVENDETTKGEHFNAMDFLDEKKETEEKDTSTKLTKEEKELAIKQEMLKAKLLKENKRKKIELKVVSFSAIIVITLITYFLGVNFIKKPIEYRYQLMYLYDIGSVTTKQEMNAHKSYITFMNVASKNGEDLEAVGDVLYNDLGLLYIYSSTSNTIEIIENNLLSLDKGLSKKYDDLEDAVFSYLQALNDLNDLLKEIPNMEYMEYREEYILRLQNVTSIQLEISNIINSKNVLGF